jgi:hypothetical protein
VSDIILQLVVSAVVGFASGAGGVYVAVKIQANDITWINRILENHDERLQFLERTGPHRVKA